MWSIPSIPTQKTLKISENRSAWHHVGVICYNPSNQGKPLEKAQQWQQKRSLAGTNFQWGQSSSPTLFSENCLFFRMSFQQFPPSLCELGPWMSLAKEH
jgi:hypothetical protein